MNILAIGAHPDDIELGCGGTLTSRRRGRATASCTVDEGKERRQATERTEELKRSAKFIGARDLKIHDYEDKS